MRIIFFLLLFSCSSFAQKPNLLKINFDEPPLVLVGPYVRGAALPVVKNGGHDPIFTYQIGMSVWGEGYLVELGFIHDSQGFSGIQTILDFRVWGIDLGHGFDLGYVLGGEFSFLARDGSTKSRSALGMKMRWVKKFSDRILLTAELPIAARFTDQTESDRGVAAEYGAVLSIRYVFPWKEK
jgi:opacity protein-like surface antigen